MPNLRKKDRKDSDTRRRSRRELNEPMFSLNNLKNYKHQYRKPRKNNRKKCKNSEEKLGKSRNRQSCKIRQSWSNSGRSKESIQPLETNSTSKISKNFTGHSKRSTRLSENKRRFRTHWKNKETRMRKEGRRVFWKVVELGIGVGNRGRMLLLIQPRF